MTATSKQEQNRQDAASYRERQRAKGLRLNLKRVDTAIMIFLGLG